MCIRDRDPSLNVPSLDCSRRNIRTLQRFIMTTAPPKPRPVPGHALSSRERSLVPVGMATILPHAAKQVRHLEARLLEQVSSWGYDEIILPTFEYLDVLAPGLEAELLETCYQFIDRTTGRTLLLSLI